MDGIALRRAIEADAATIGALHVVSWHETYAGILPDEMLAGLSTDARTEMWSKTLERLDDFDCIAVIIAEDDGRAVGFGSCGRQRDAALADAGFSGEIGAIYVLRSYQGHGVGRSIITALSKALWAAGHSAACLWVLRQNDPARRFYEKLGGIVVGEKIDEQPHAGLVEDAFGWRDLSSLVS